MLFNGFNTACKNIAASFLKVGDELMSAIRFWTTFGKWLVIMWWKIQLITKTSDLGGLILPPPFICIHVCFRLKYLWPKPSELLYPSERDT